MSERRRASTAATLAAVLLLGPSAGATSWIRWDVQRASRECPRICVGEVTKATARKLPTEAYGPDGICTEITIKVERPLKGMDPDSRTFTFWVPGGAAGGEVLEIAGTPALSPGDRALFFFYESEGRFWPLWGGVAPVVRGVVIGRKGHTIERSARLDDVVVQIARLVSEIPR
jgi:hypothetical protein